MSYCTLEAFIQRFGEADAIGLTDRVGGGIPDAAVFARAEVDARAEIDGYVGVRYALPLLVVPDAISRIAGDIMRYRLTEGLVSEEVRTRYEDARRWLESVSAGRIALDQPLRSVALASGGVAVVAPLSVFGGIAGYMGAGW